LMIVTSGIVGLDMVNQDYARESPVRKGKITVVANLQVVYGLGRLKAK
jgi:hypothetical protein